jgi:AraC-like DNA-binding protein
MNTREFSMKLESSGFTKVKNNGNYPKEGTLYKVPEEIATGYYWVYMQDDLFDIKIHDFYYHEDTVFEVDPGYWPQCLNIAYYQSVSGEEFNPYRRMTAGCVKTFFGGADRFRSIFHKKIPLRSIGIEIFPAYYENYLKEVYGTEYIDPVSAFHTIDQTQNFPEMVSLLTQIWNYHEEGMSAKLFYEAKVAETISLMIDYSKRSKSDNYIVSAQDRLLVSNVSEYIHDHFNCDITLEHLSKIACMGTTKLKTTFKAVYQCTITQYIKERRLSHAENLLATTALTIEQISAAVGYHNAGRFAAAFKQNCGLYPSEYRKSILR